jgi:hypothetical protein
VFDTGKLLGNAPGTFTISYGGHAIEIECTETGKKEMRKVFLSMKKDTERISYSCAGKK